MAAAAVAGHTRSEQQCVHGISILSKFLHIADAVYWLDNYQGAINETDARRHTNNSLLAHLDRGCMQQG